MTAKNAVKIAGSSPSAPHARRPLPENLTTASGKPRRVGFELEFSGIDLDRASRVIAESLSAERLEESSARHIVRSDDLGDFVVEIDWHYFKRIAADEADRQGVDWTELVRDWVTALVPVEVVCPPIDIEAMDQLEPLVSALRDAGAEGTQTSPWAAYGVHINAEAPSLEASALHRYLRAFCLLQWWLIDAHDVDIARRVTPYVEPYPEDYLRSIHRLQRPGMEALINHYLEFNATRNRALDMLPLFAEVDPERVSARVSDDRVNARPAFHYRLPDCRIDDEAWSLWDSWSKWCVIEKLANDDAALDALTNEFNRQQDGLNFAGRRKWRETVDQWLNQ
jgi:hypothetical protein